MLKIRIETIPHSQQRYDTVGDWFVDDGWLVIRVSDLGSWKQETCVAVHELVEYSLCMAADVMSDQVDAFDMAWKPHGGIEEPGDDMDAPYYQQHQVACAIERFMASELQLNWAEYERVLAAQ